MEAVVETLKAELKKRKEGVAFKEFDPWDKPTARLASDDLDHLVCWDEFLVMYQRCISDTSGLEPRNLYNLVQSRPFQMKRFESAKLAHQREDSTCSCFWCASGMWRFVLVCVWDCVVCVVFVRVHRQAYDVDTVITRFQRDACSQTFATNQNRSPTQGASCL